jgi:hypothetical protein
MNEKWLPVLENEELMMKVVPMAPEEAQKELAANGYNFTMDEIIEMGKDLYALRSKANSDGELSEGDLEDVAGGVAWGPVIKFTFQAAAGAMSVW